MEPPDGIVEVDLSAGTLSVRDHGPGFRDEDLAFVFDRFHRATDARSKPGSGLGLAIVRETAEAHGGAVQADNAPGGGAVVRIGFGPVLEPGEDAPESALETPRSAQHGPLSPARGSPGPGRPGPPRPTA
jgi:signal transduction histidine kinase